MIKELTDKLHGHIGINCGGKADVRDNIDARKYLTASEMAVFPDEFFSLVKYANGIKTDFAEIYAIDPLENTGFTDAVRQNERLDRQDQQTVAVLGETCFDYLVFDTESNQYQLRDKEDDMTLTRFGNLAEAILYILKI